MSPFPNSATYLDHLVHSLAGTNLRLVWSQLTITSPRMSLSLTHLLNLLKYALHFQSPLAASSPPPFLFTRPWRYITEFDQSFQGLHDPHLLLEGKALKNSWSHSLQLRLTTLPVTLSLKMFLQHLHHMTLSSKAVSSCLSLTNETTGPVFNIYSSHWPYCAFTKCEMFCSFKKSHCFHFLAFEERVLSA